MAYLEKQYFDSYYMVHTKDFENYECVNNYMVTPKFSWLSWVFKGFDMYMSKTKQKVSFSIQIEIICIK